MKVDLVYPRSEATNDAVYTPSRTIDHFIALAARLVDDRAYVPGKRAFYVPPLNLLLLASYLPLDVEVRIIDERVRKIDYDSKTDLVGITSLTADAPHVYEIADEYRRCGVKVVLGGIHPTVMPQEAIQHSDAVVIGECDDLIQQIVADVQAGTLQEFYRRSTLHNLRGLPRLRKDLIDDRYYITPNVIQATRGCPHRCTFCSVSVVSGPTYRCRPVEDVVDEIAASGPGFFAFVDDNVGGNLPYARALFGQMGQLGVHWFGNITTAALRDARLLERLSRSGCKIVLIGFESLSRTTLKNLDKSFNRAEQYSEIVKQVHAMGIGVIGSFMLGLDDAPDDVNEIIRFALSAPLDIAQISILTPYPGTELFDEMDLTGRLRTKDWRSFDTTAANVVFAPKQSTPERLQDGYLEVLDRLYSVFGIARRMLRSRTYPTFFLPYNIRQRKKTRTARQLINQRRGESAAMPPESI